MHALSVLFCTLLLPSLTWAAVQCEARPSAAASLARLTQVMSTGRFVAYQPTSLQIVDGRATPADEASITEDLKVLRPRFDGLITYGSLHGAERIPDIAAGLGYRAVIMGVWDIANATEIGNALAARQRHPRLVVGLSLGNELLFGKRATADRIVRVIEDVRSRAPQLALSTTEPFHLFVEPSAERLMPQLDFVLPNVHPVFQPWFREAPDANAAEFVVNVVNELESRSCGPILVKETGVPTAPSTAGYTADRQASFYRTLQARFPASSSRAFAYFSAFDAPWREHDEHPVPGQHPEEAHWGLFDHQRRPKPVVAGIAALKPVDNTD